MTTEASFAKRLSGELGNINRGGTNLGLDRKRFPLGPQPSSTRTTTNINAETVTMPVLSRGRLAFETQPTVGVSGIKKPITVEYQGKVPKDALFIGPLGKSVRRKLHEAWDSIRTFKPTARRRSVLRPA